MNDVKFYDFMIRLNNYLSISNVLADNFSNQEIELQKHIQTAKAKLPKKIFDLIFNPMVKILLKRVELMGKIRKTNMDFEAYLQEFLNYYKGITQ